MRRTVASVAAALPSEAVLLSVAKGIERETLLRMTQVIAEEVPVAAARVAALSGPNLALEISRGLPAAAVVAGEDAVSRRVVDILGSRNFRLYRNRDIVGVELAGALKNIVAIVAGAVETLGAGDNAKAAITTRGLAEMTRLGVAMGANPLTFAGLAGIGDILATSTSALSRNHRLGVELAAGRAWSEIERTLPGVAEGAYTVRAALALAERHAVEMPIAQEVHAVLYEGKDVQTSVVDLLARESKDEIAGSLADGVPDGERHTMAAVMLVPLVVAILVLSISGSGLVLEGARPRWPLSRLHRWRLPRRWRLLHPRRRSSTAGG